MSAREKALRDWNGAPPDWVMTLADECDRTSQAKTAKRIGVSAAVVNQTLGNRYPGRLDQVERKVRNVLLSATVLCPFLGAPLARKTCDENRSRTTIPTHSPHALQLWRACQTCPENSAMEA